MVQSHVQEQENTEIPANHPRGLFSASIGVTGDAASAQTGGFWHGDTRLFLGTQRSKWSRESSSPVCLSQCLPGPSKPKLNLLSRGTPNTRMGDQDSWPCCPVRQAGTARDGRCIIPLKLQKQAKCNYNHPSWSSARTSVLMVSLSQEVPWDFSNDHKWSRPQFHISFGR